MEEKEEEGGILSGALRSERERRTIIIVATCFNNKKNETYTRIRSEKVSDQEDPKSKFPKEFWPLVDILNAESHRGRALVEAGFLEEQLKQILLSFFVDCPQALDLVEGGNAPLGTFSSRISTCYALGLITKDEHDDLHIIRKIRNEFAHNMEVNFDSEAFANRCRALKIFGDDDPENPAHPLGRFGYSCIRLIINLWYRHRGVGKEKRTARLGDVSPQK